MPTQVAEAAQGVGSLMLERFAAVRAETLRFAAPLTPEDLMVQSTPEASPVKWHLAHTSWFFETFVLTEFLPGYKAFHPDFRWLFNSYYNALGEMPEKKLRASFSRPPLDAILDYRRYVDAHVQTLLTDDLGGETADEVVRRIALGLEHEQQHLELIATDIKHALFTNPLHPAYLDAPAPAGVQEPLPAMYTSFAGGLVEAGITPDADDPQAFAFDNETPRHTVFLQPFALCNRLVTCSEYLLFVDDNGYSRPELWLSEGWTTMRAAGWQAPFYWTRDSAAGSGWAVYTLHGFQPLDALLETPVCHLSYFEADAFARWSALHTPGARLPTEFEWEYGCRSANVAEANLLESDALHPVPAPLGDGLRQMFGDVWEWTASPYTGYPGYRALPGALGEYNGKFMSSQVILRGGSCVTPRSHIRATYRNFFPPSTRWQFSGLRLARGASEM